MGSEAIIDMVINEIISLGIESRPSSSQADTVRSELSRTI
jgi:hypothetical protein